MCGKQGEKGPKSKPARWEGLWASYGAIATPTELSCSPATELRLLFCPSSSEWSSQSGWWTGVHDLGRPSFFLHVVLSFTPCTAIKAQKEHYPKQGYPSRSPGMLSCSNSWATIGTEPKGFSLHIWSPPLLPQGEPEATHGSILA